MQLTCQHDPADPNHLICELNEPRRHRLINFVIAGGVLWFVFLTGLTGWIILSRGRGVDSLQTCPVWCAGLSESLLRTRVSAGDVQYGQCIRCAPARADSYVTLYGINSPSALREGSPQDSFDPRAPVLGNSVDGGKIKESLDYSGQKDLYHADVNEPDLEAQALYFSKEGEQIGRGPWPPKSGEATRLKVFLRVTGVLGDHGVSAPIITGELGKNVQWTSFAPMGAGLSYEPAVRKIRQYLRWRSPQLPSKSRENNCR